jgi:cytochrome c oxidase cbb3-type subunit III
MSNPGADAPQAARPSTEDSLLEHEYDGIREYDNPLPGWWLATLYATVIFAVVYFLNVIPGVGSGQGRVAEYEASMTAAQAAAQAANAGRDPLAGLSDEAVLAIARDPAKLELGRTTFASTCAACHAPDGGGLIGPNLTDGYWIHGGRPAEILNTVNVGVLDKGMPAWGKALPPEQVLAAAAYVTTLRGTTPQAPKAPQGVPADSAAVAPPAGR